MNKYPPIGLTQMCFKCKLNKKIFFCFIQKAHTCEMKRKKAIEKRLS